MVKHQKISRAKPAKPTTVITEKSLPVPQIAIDPKYANAPVRTVNFVEVGNMAASQIQLMLSELSKMHDSARGGIHYFLPVRNGKIGSDVVFEQEFEKIGKELFEIIDKNGTVIANASIRLKGGAKDTLVIRERI